jgi:hypothetical protein
MSEIPRLRVSVEDAERALKYAINIGIGFKWAEQRGAEFHKTEKKLDEWYTDTKDTLQGLFSTPEKAEEFIKIVHGISDEIPPEDKRYLPKIKTYENRLAWLRRLKENLSIYVVEPKPQNRESATTEFEKVTLRWLWNHLPVKMWLALTSSIVVIFGAGATFGRFRLGQLSNRQPVSQTEPHLSNEQYKAQINEVTRGHNERLKILNDGLVGLYRSYTYTDQASTSVSIEDIKKQIDYEYGKYNADLKTLEENVLKQK